MQKHQARPSKATVIASAPGQQAGRHHWFLLAAMTALLMALALPVRAGAGVQTANSQAELSPQAALQLLKEGNARFVAGDSLQRDLPAQVQATAGGQYPHSVVLSCIDSRAAPELLFDQGIGDIFSPRVAGNFVDPELLGSMEFAAAVAGSRAIVVLGHSECGAVKGACDDVKLGNLTQTLSHIRPAVASVEGFEHDRSSGNKAFVDAVAHANVHQTVADILAESKVLADLVDKGDLVVVGAMYDVATGQVTFFED